MNYFERFLSSSERFSATHDLASSGDQAIPILESLFNGSATNKYGVSYSKIGAMDCGFITIKLLGSIAKPLESYVKKGIEGDYAYAIDAAGFLRELQEDTVLALAEALLRNPSSEAAVSLVRCGQAENIKVIEIIKNNHIALNSMERATVYLSTQT
jgi:hypothetical protein